MTSDANARNKENQKNANNFGYLGDLNNGKANRLLFGGRLNPTSCANSSHTLRISSSVSVSLAFKMHNFRISFSWSDILYLVQHQQNFFDDAQHKNCRSKFTDFFNQKQSNLFECPNKKLFGYWNLWNLFNFFYDEKLWNSKLCVLVRRLRDTCCSAFAFEEMLIVWGPACKWTSVRKCAEHKRYASTTKTRTFGILEND